MDSSLAELLNELHTISETHLLQLSAIIHRMGMDDKTKLEWVSIIKEQVHETYGALIDDANTYQNRLIDSIETLLQRSEALCKKLHIKMPSYGSGNLNLSEEKLLLQERVTEYENIVKARKTELDNLRNRQLQTCKSLEREPMIMPDSPLPTVEEINHFAHFVEKLEDEKFQRHEKFIDFKCKILDILRDLQITPSLEMEKAVCSSDDSLFIVNDVNMKWIADYYDSLMHQKSRRIDEITNLRQRLPTLWKILSEDLKKCNDFLEKYTGNSLATLEALRMEVKRCENLKNAHIEKFIEKMRAELITLWEKCNFSASDREEFVYFQDSSYTEDLLTFHEKEVERMRKYYADNKHTLMLLEQREEYWKMRLEHEAKICDPKRFKNRGASLLKHQKEYNRVVQKISDVERKLLEFAERYHETYGKPFLSWGRNITDIIERTHEDYEVEKKNQLSAKKLQRHLAVTPPKSGLLLGSTLSSSRKSLLTLTPTNAGLKPQKRKLPPTSLFPSNKKKTQLKENTPMIKVKVEKTNNSDNKAHRYSIERKKRLNKMRRVNNMITKKKAQKKDLVDYDKFEKAVDMKTSSSRSTSFDAGSGSLAVPLPQTPRSGRTTPQRNHQATGKMRTHTKLRTAPGSKMNV